MNAASTAEVATPQDKRYMAQLCKHFRHKLPVTLDNAARDIAFRIGRRPGAANGRQTLSLDSPDNVQLMQLQDVVARQLHRFAFREPMQLVRRPA